MSSVLSKNKGTNAWRQLLVEFVCAVYFVEMSDWLSDFRRMLALCCLNLDVAVATRRDLSFLVVVVYKTVAVKSYITCRLYPTR